MNPARRIVTVLVDEQDLSLIRHIESAKIINNAPGAGFDPEETSLPLSAEEASALLDTEGYASTVIEVSLEAFARGMVGDSSPGENDIYDTLHKITFGDVGAAEDSDYEVLGVTQQSSALIIRYTTRLAPFLGKSGRHEDSYPRYR